MSPLLLKKVPDDIRKYLIKIQGEVKNETGISQFSLESTLYKIVRKQIELEGKPKRVS